MINWQTTWCAVAGGVVTDEQHWGSHVNPICRFQGLPIGQDPAQQPWGINFQNTEKPSKTHRWNVSPFWVLDSEWSNKSNGSLGFSASHRWVLPLKSTCEGWHVDLKMKNKTNLKDKEVPWQTHNRCSSQTSFIRSQRTTLVLCLLDHTFAFWKVGQWSFISTINTEIR